MPRPATLVKQLRSSLSPCAVRPHLSITISNRSCTARNAKPRVRSLFYPYVLSDKRVNRQPGVSGLSPSLPYLGKHSLRAESAKRACVGSGGLGLAVFGDGGGHERGKQGRCCFSHVIDRPIEGFSVCDGRRGESADLPYELQGRSPDLLVCRGRIEVVQCPDIPAHVRPPRCSSFQCDSRRRLFRRPANRSRETSALSSLVPPGRKKTNRCPRKGYFTAGDSSWLLLLSGLVLGLVGLAWFCRRHMLRLRGSHTLGSRDRLLLRCDLWWRSGFATGCWGGGACGGATAAGVVVLAVVRHARSGTGCCGATCGGGAGLATGCCGAAAVGLGLQAVPRLGLGAGRCGGAAPFGSCSGCCCGAAAAVVPRARVLATGCCGGATCGGGQVWPPAAGVSVRVLHALRSCTGYEGSLLWCHAFVVGQLGPPVRASRCSGPAAGC